MLGKEYPECGIACAQQLDAIIKNEGPDSVAAFIAEPMHGTAGDIPPVPEYWPMVREICDKHDVLLIADEVMTGFGRTGKAFAMQHWNVLPDMLCMAKGITSTYAPFGALGLGEKVYAGLKGMAIPGQTYGGHPLGAAVASKVMEIYVRDKIFENCAAMGEYAMGRLIREFSPLPHVGEISGLGLQIGIEIVEDKAARKGFAPESGVMLDIFRKALAAGLLVRETDQSWSPSNRLSFAPPLIVTPAEVDRMLDILFPIVAGL
jgi:putrescine---pyruvate transaminase